MFTLNGPLGKANIDSSSHTLLQAVGFLRSVAITRDYCKDCTGICIHLLVQEREKPTFGPEFRASPQTAPLISNPTRDIV